MTRLIDADAIEYDFNIKTYADNRVMVTKLLADKDTIDAMPTIEPCRWIPVSERLPESYKDVLVWYEYFNYGFNSMYHGYGIGFCSPDGTWHGDVSGTKAKCLAWMPLPDAYEEDK